MEMRGDRECTECGGRWSYYDTGSVACPDCGSLRSVGVEAERSLHTDRAVDMDLAAARSAAADQPVREAAALAADAAGAYVRNRGFVSGGELRRLDGTYVAAAELRYAAGSLERALGVSEAEEHYFVELLAGAPDGERPDAGAVPESLRSARGLAAADAVRAFRRDAAAWLGREGPDPAGRDVLDRLEHHARRIEVLDGEVSPADADRLVAAAVDVGDYLLEGDEVALESARGRLDRLGE